MPGTASGSRQRVRELGSAQHMATYGPMCARKSGAVWGPSRSKAFLFRIQDDGLCFWRFIAVWDEWF